MTTATIPRYASDASPDEMRKDQLRKLLAHLVDESPTVVGKGKGYVAV